ncbi:MAG: hypothetical protein HC896_13750 [Bacteroidales bacterium]|nr:hypothetical protein [Bacteroidales bacterium]
MKLIYKSTLSGFFLLFLFQQCFSQITNVKFDYAKPREYEVGGIVVTGVEFLNPNVLTNLAGVNNWANGNHTGR